MLPCYSVCQRIRFKIGSKRRNNFKERIIEPLSASSCTLCKTVSSKQVLSWRAARPNTVKQSTHINLLALGKDLRKDSSKPISKALSRKVAQRKLDISESSITLPLKTSSKKSSLIKEPLVHIFRSDIPTSSKKKSSKSVTERVCASPDIQVKRHSKKRRRHSPSPVRHSSNSTHVSRKQAVVNLIDIRTISQEKLRQLSPTTVESLLLAQSSIVQDKQKELATKQTIAQKYSSPKPVKKFRFNRIIDSVTDSDDDNNSDNASVHSDISFSHLSVHEKDSPVRVSRSSHTFVPDRTSSPTDQYPGKMLPKNIKPMHLQESCRLDYNPDSSINVFGSSSPFKYIPSRVSGINSQHTASATRFYPYNVDTIVRDTGKNQDTDFSSSAEFTSVSHLLAQQSELESQSLVTDQVLESEFIVRLPKPPLLAARHEDLLLTMDKSKTLDAYPSQPKFINRVEFDPLPPDFNVNTFKRKVSTVPQSYNVLMSDRGRSTRAQGLVRLPITAINAMELSAIHLQELAVFQQRVNSSVLSNVSQCQTEFDGLRELVMRQCSSLSFDVKAQLVASIDSLGGRLATANLASAVSSSLDSPVIEHSVFIQASTETARINKIIADTPFHSALSDEAKEDLRFSSLGKESLITQVAIDAAVLDKRGGYSKHRLINSKIDYSPQGTAPAQAGQGF